MSKEITRRGKLQILENSDHPIFYKGKGNFVFFCVEQEAF